MSGYRNSWWGVGAIALSLVLSACAGPGANDGNLTVSLVSFNDFHGNLLPANGTATVADPRSGQAVKVPAGGVAYLTTLVRQLKAQNPDNTIIVAAGDLVGASPQVSGMFHDEPTIEAMNRIGLELSSVGNHEFDKGRDELLRLQNGGCFPPSADGTRGMVGVDTCMNDGKFSGAQYRYLAANVIDQKTGQSLFPPYAIRKVGGVRLGFIGVVLKDTPAVVTPAGVAGLRFEDEAATVNRLVPELQRQGVQAIVVLMHQGAATTAQTINDQSCPGFNGDAIKIVDSFDPAVRVVVTGHTHEEFVCRRPDGKLMTQAGNYGRMATRIDLRIEPASGKIIQAQAINHVAVNDTILKDANGQALPLPPQIQRLTKDAAQDALVQRYAKLTAKHAEVPVARITGFLDRKANAAGESTLGDVVADAYLAATTDADYGARAAQIAFVNAGGMRNDLNRDLTVTYGHLYTVHPFGNNLVTLDLTGQQLLRLLEQQWESPQPPGGRILSVSSGFSYVWDARQPEGAAPGTGQRVVRGSMTLHGQPIDLAKTYRVTINSFMVSGGDSFTVFTEGRRLQEGGLDLDALTQYFRSKKAVAVPARDRIHRRP